MASDRDAVETGDEHSSEADALLHCARPSTTGDAFSASIASMEMCTNKACWSLDKPTTNHIPDGGTELASESFRDRQDLDSAHLRAQGHEAALKRSFSPLAALGLGFR